MPDGFLYVILAIVYIVVGILLIATVGSAIMALTSVFMFAIGRDRLPIPVVILIAIAVVALFSGITWVPALLGNIYEGEMWVRYLDEYSGGVFVASVFAILPPLIYIISHTYKVVRAGDSIKEFFLERRVGAAVWATVMAFILFIFGRVHHFVPDMILAVNNEYHFAEVESWRLRITHVRSSTFRRVVINPDTDNSWELRLPFDIYRELARIEGGTASTEIINQPIRIYYLPHAGFVIGLETAATLNARGWMYLRDEENYEQAVYWFRRAAEQGHASAQFNLGWMYSQGRGLAQDYEQAVYWYRQAAEQGNVGAMVNLGVLYDRGHGVTQCHEQAVYWYRQAAEQENAVAQSNLALMYRRGRGVAQDNVRAVYWGKQAAEQGHETAQFNLGLWYSEGIGVAQDYERAAYWYRRAIEQGSDHAQTNLDILYQRGVLD